VTVLSIGEVGRRAKLSAAALRYYESLGLIASCDRVGGKRVFAASVLDQLALIRLAQGAGFTLGEIVQLLRARRVRTRKAAGFWRRAVATKRTAVEERAAHLAHTLRVLDALARCDCATPEQCGREFARLSRSPH
jgi:DNA-binding transcriptional MerR regulator